MGSRVSILRLHWQTRSVLKVIYAFIVGNSYYVVKCVYVFALDHVGVRVVRCFVLFGYP